MPKTGCALWDVPVVRLFCSGIVLCAFATWDLNVNVFSWDVPSFVLLSASFDGVGCKTFCLVCWAFWLTNDVYLFPRETFCCKIRQNFVIYNIYQAKNNSYSPLLFLLLFCKIVCCLVKTRKHTR